VSQIVAIAAGGAVGALLRFWASNGVYALLGRAFPYGTLAVNVVGSLAMGFLFVWFVERAVVGAEWRAAVLIGLLGAFTTFSTFSIETLTLIEGGEPLKALLNAVLSLLLCVVACAFGVVAARQL
jgi:CrcB protein